MQGVHVQYLVGKLRSHMPCGQKTKKHKRYTSHTHTHKIVTMNHKRILYVWQLFFHFPSPLGPTCLVAKKPKNIKDTHHTHTHTKLWPWTTSGFFMFGSCFFTSLPHLFSQSPTSLFCTNFTLFKILTFPSLSLLSADGLASYFPVKIAAIRWELIFLAASAPAYSILSIIMDELAILLSKANTSS